MTQEKRYTAIVQQVYPNGAHGPYAKARSEKLGSVTFSLLREVLGGRTRTHKKGVEEMQRAITQQYRSHSQKIANLLRGLSDKYDDGDVSARQVAAVLDHIEKSHKNVNRRVADWRKRMAASGAETASAKKAA